MNLSADDRSWIKTELISALRDEIKEERLERKKLDERVRVVENTQGRHDERIKFQAGKVATIISTIFSFIVWVLTKLTEQNFTP